jgi:hypothetical protein
LYTELILGLPGESLTTWKQNFYKLFKAGNHTGITVYQAQLLENAEMNLLQRKLYRLEGRIVYDYLVGTYNEHELKEGIEVIVSTKDMPRDDMVEAQVFSWFMNTFHINGITNFISRYLHKQGTEYELFYGKLLEHVQIDPWFNSEIDRIKEHYRRWTDNGLIDHDPIQGMEIHGWNLIHSTMINLHGQGKHKHVFEVIEEFMRDNFELDEDILQELLTIQKTFVVNHSRISEYPLIVESKLDILGYIQHNTDLNVPSKYEFDFPEDKTMSLQRFCEQIFFARRRNFGKAWVTKQ